MASSMVRAVCWKCDKSFPSLRERKNHMANKEHNCLRVICPFCPKEKFLRRSNPELLDYCTKQHKREVISLPKGFFAEANGFWLSRHPRDYMQLVEPTGKTDIQAVKARELIRGKFHSGSKELEAWEAGWALVNQTKRSREPSMEPLVSQMKRTRDPSMEPESNFQPDYEEHGYSPSKPKSDAEFRLGELTSVEGGLEAILVSEDEAVWYKVFLSKAVCSMEREIASVFRRLRAPLPCSKPESWRHATISQSLAKTLSKGLGVSSSLIRSAKFATIDQLARPVKRTKREPTTLSVPSDKSREDTTTKGSPFQPSYSMPVLVGDDTKSSDGTVMDGQGNTPTSLKVTPSTDNQPKVSQSLQSGMDIEVTNPQKDQENPTTLKDVPSADAPPEVSKSPQPEKSSDKSTPTLPQKEQEHSTSLKDVPSADDPPENSASQSEKSSDVFSPSSISGNKVTEKEEAETEPSIVLSSEQQELSQTNLEDCTDDKSHTVLPEFSPVHLLTPISRLSSEDPDDENSEVEDLETRSAPRELPESLRSTPPEEYMF
ncbi:hypothetical protein FSP39_013038 [Pinctada imbricata]|uniref:C2H2-type domain-containing protein n=1 Tax=Pinctada imbricata TaxID=66713 RepID=A0AA89C3B6_PINIB|nr:hypothetical protein FSP39_013038 [Pinctada imbricata]